MRSRLGQGAEICSLGGFQPRPPLGHASRQLSLATGSSDDKSRCLQSGLREVLSAAIARNPRNTVSALDSKLAHLLLLNKKRRRRQLNDRNARYARKTSSHT